MANEYVTVAELKAALKISGAAEDTNLATAAEAASRSIDKRTGRRFYPDADANQIRTYLPVGPDYVKIDDLVTLTSVSDASGTWTLNTDFLLAPTTAPAEGRPWDTLRTVRTGAGGWWPEASQESGYGAAGRRFTRNSVVTVTGKFGWATVPPEVKEATMILASQLFLRPRQAVFGVVGLGFEGEGARISSFDPNVFSLLEPYMRSSMVE